MIKKIKKYIYPKLYTPNIIGLFVNPFFISRIGLYYGIKKMGQNITGKTLDVGCGQKPYQNLFNCSQYIGMDIKASGHNHESSVIDVFYDGKTFPFENETFDSIITNQVFEHVFNPEEFMKEISRVLKPEGFLLITVPFVWDEHEQPFDYARYTSFGLAYILKLNNFNLVESYKTNSNIGAIFQLLNMYLYKILSFNFFTRILSLIFIVPLNFIGLILSIILPKNKDLYLDNVILAKKNHNV